MTVAEMYAVARCAARRVPPADRDDAIQDAILAMLRWPPPNKPFARMRARWGIKEGQRRMQTGGMRHPRNTPADQRPFFDPASEEVEGARYREPYVEERGFARVDARLDCDTLRARYPRRLWRILVLRDGHGWTNAEVGRELRVCPTYVSKLYHGGK